MRLYEDLRLAKIKEGGIIKPMIRKMVRHKNSKLKLRGNRTRNRYGSQSRYISIKNKRMDMERAFQSVDNDLDRLFPL